MVGRSRPFGPSPRWWLPALILILFPVLVPMASSAQVDDDGFLAVAQDWEARRLPDTDPASGRCAARAYHPRLGAGEVMWIFDPAVMDAYPKGYLVVDRRLTTADAPVSAILENGRAIRLPFGHDLHAYSPSDDSPGLFESMRRDLVLTLVTGPAADGQPMAISLLGFSRATDVAAAACDVRP